MYARVISTDPAVVHDGRTPVHLNSITPDAAAGDWVEVSGDSATRVVQRTGVPFPGHQWRTMQYPGDDGRTRMELHAVPRPRTAGHP